MKRKKVYFLTPTEEDFKKIQLRLFDLGYDWDFGNTKHKLFIPEDGYHHLVTNFTRLGSIHYSSSSQLEQGFEPGSIEDLFETDKYKLIKQEDVLEIL